VRDAPDATEVVDLVQLVLLDDILHFLLNDEDVLTVVVPRTHAQTAAAGVGSVAGGLSS